MTSLYQKRVNVKGLIDDSFSHHGDTTDFDIDTAIRGERQTCQASIRRLCRLAEPFEDAVFELAELVGTRVHEKYLAGQITTEDLQFAYEVIRLWTKLAEELLYEID